jgi:2-methylisocitrate lyase-like PEP mutase family enzyme
VYAVVILPLSDAPSFAKTASRALASFVLDASKETVVASGVKIAIYPFQSVVVAYLAANDLLKELADTGAVASFAKVRPATKELEQLVGSQLAQQYKVV